MLCSGPHIYRLFFNLGVFRPRGFHVLRKRLQYRVGLHFAQVLNELTAKLKERTGLNFLRALQNLANVIFDFSNFGVLLWCETKCFLKKSDGGLHSPAVGNTFRRLSAKSSNYVKQDTEVDK